MKRTLVLTTMLLAMLLVTTGCLPSFVSDPSLLQSDTTVPASIDATGATDVSAAMAAFVASVPDGSIIRLQPGARYRMESTLQLTGRHDLLIDGAGSTIFATTPGDRNRSNIQVLNSSNITISNIVITGANPYAGVGDAAQDLAREGQQGIDVRSSTGFVLVGSTITDTYGDFVWIGRDNTGPWTQDVLIRGNTFTRSGRHGVTVTAGRNVLVEQNSIDQIRFATFDMEAHHPGFGMVSVTIRDNEVGAGRGLLVASVGTGDRDDFTFQRNHVARPLDIWMSSEDGVVHHNWKILDNTSTTVAGNRNLTTMRFDHLDGLTVQGNSQTYDSARSMVGAQVTASCNVNIQGNSYPGALSQGTVVGTC